MKKKTIKRIAMVLGVLVLCFAGLAAYLFHDEGPADNSDLRLESLNIPEEQNAATWFVRAGEKLTWARQFDEDGTEMTSLDEIYKIWADNSEAMELARKGLACKQIELVAEIPKGVAL